MNVLVIGSGAREHAFCWKLSKSANISEIYVAPGNAGTTKVATNLNLDISDFKKIKECLLTYSITLMIVGPEIPLIEGLVDFVENDPEISHVLTAVSYTHLTLPTNREV